VKVRVILIMKKMVETIAGTPNNIENLQVKVIF
jgi:hypothetical protein